jgi:hypothetical protein
MPTTSAQPFTRRTINFGDTWPTSTRAGNPAVTLPPATPQPLPVAVRDRATRLVAYEVWKLNQADHDVIVAVTS